jgi:acyl-CoA synthetase (AMP-forming)/AMP-acid ligase II
MAADLARIHEIVGRWAASAPDREALAFGDRRWTWAQVDDRVRRAAGALRAAGVGPGHRFAVLDKNHPACVELSLAASAIGAVNAVVNFRLSPEELVYVLNDCEAMLVVVGAEFTALLDGLRDRLPNVQRVVVLGGDADEYEALLAAAEPAGTPFDSAPDDCCVQLYTSGTTGYPKGAMLTQRSMTAHTVAVGPAYGMDEGTVNIVAMPLFHVGGTSWALGSMYAGGRTVIVREMVPSAILDLVESEAATHAFFVPAVVQMLIADPDRARAALGSLQVLGYGGSPMPAPLMERTLDTVPTPLYSVYGMTEMSGVFCVLGPDEHRDPERKHLRASAGRPLPMTTVRVVDPATGKDVEARAGRRVLGPVRPGDGRLLQQPGSDRRGVRRRLAAHRRRGPDRCRGLPVPRGSGQRPDHLRRGEHLSRGGRASARPAPGRRGGRRHRRTAREVGRDGQGRRRACRRGHPRRG